MAFLGLRVREVESFICGIRANSPGLGVENLIQVPLWPVRCCALGKAVFLSGPRSMLVVRQGPECRSLHSRSFAFSTTAQKHLLLSVHEAVSGMGAFFQKCAVRDLSPNHSSPTFPSCRYFPLNLRLPWGYQTVCLLQQLQGDPSQRRWGQGNCLGEASNAFPQLGSITVCHTNG